MSQENILFPLTKESSWKEAHIFLIQLFDSEKVKTFLSTLGTHKETPETIITFLNSEEFKNAFEKKWEYESDEKIWPNRSPLEAFKETVEHALTKIVTDASLQKLIYSKPPDSDGYNQVIQKLKLIGECFLKMAQRIKV